MKSFNQDTAAFFRAPKAKDFMNWVIERSYPGKERTIQLFHFTHDPVPCGGLLTYGTLSSNVECSRCGVEWDTSGFCDPVPLELFRLYDERLEPIYKIYFDDKLGCNMMRLATKEEAANYWRKK